MTSAEIPLVVTFNHAFKLNEMTESFPPGTYEILTEKVPLDVSWEAYRTSMTILLRDGGVVSALPVTTDELSEALSRDTAYDRKDGFS